MENAARSNTNTKQSLLFEDIEVEIMENAESSNTYTKQSLLFEDIEEEEYYAQLENEIRKDQGTDVEDFVEKEIINYEPMNVDEHEEIASLITKNVNLTQTTCKILEEDENEVEIDAKIKDIETNGIVTMTPDGDELHLKVTFKNLPTIKKEPLLKAKVLPQIAELTSKIESGETSVDELIKRLKSPYLRTIAELKNKKNCAESVEQLNYLKNETKLTVLDTEIKKAASFVKDDPETCLKLLDELQTVDIQPLMIKKHAEVVDTVRTLIKYTDQSLIRDKAKDVLTKIKSLFDIPSGKSFSEVLFREQMKFLVAVQHLSLERISLLTSEPQERRKRNVKKLKPVTE